ncbi:hypothetical protein R3P38DRAFT_2758943 [Favolaschia claudopus]|uniref:Uncharacterized protein n=1 Tax=Favolaschia claudopus TaxID=2862362 RepID=A0AAW0E294_9AGAR
MQWFFDFDDASLVLPMRQLNFDTNHSIQPILEPWTKIFDSGDSRMLKSQFVLVTLFFAKLASNIATGEQSFAWDIDGSASHSGKLADIPVDKGKLKFVFKVLILDGTPYVAKRCFALGDGSPVSILGNREQLVKEATTLGRTLKISRGNVKRKE